MAPRVSDVTPAPASMVTSDAMTVAAKVERTLRDITAVQLVYRVMYNDEVSITMTDDGTGADAVANDGYFTATIPGGVAQPGEMLRYYVAATDQTGEVGRYPQLLDTSGTDQSAQYLGTVVNDPAVDSDLPVFQWFSEQVSRARSRSGARASVYFNGEFYDNVFVRQRGGATNGSSQKFNFNDDQPFYVNEILGRVAEFNMNAQGSDSTYIRQPMAFNAYRDAGNESSESFLMAMRVNGARDRTGVFIEQVDEDFLKRNKLDPDGALYKFVQRSNLDPVFSDITTGIEKKTRLDEGLEDVAMVVDGLTQANRADRGISVFDNFNVAQMLNYLAVRSITMDADDVRKNFYMYRDTNGTGQWSIFPWDKDWTFGIEGDGGPGLSHPFFGDEERRKPNANQWNRLYDTVFNDPVLSEMYLRRLRTVMDQLLQPPGTSDSEGHFEQAIVQIQATATKDLSSGILGQANAIRSFLETRRDTLYNQHSIDLLESGETRTIIPEFSNVEYFVPTDNSLGTTWTGIAAPSNAAAWSTGQAGLGFESGSNFTGLIRTEVQPNQACSECTSIYVRIPFDVTNAASIEKLTLQMKYDDGFIAYLNGQEVLQQNIRSGDVSYDMRANSHANSAAAEFENFNISNFANLLVEGRNVLAIHGVNSSASSNDQLVSPQLIEGVIADDSAAGIPHEQIGNPSIQFGSFDHNPVGGQDQEFIELVNPNDTAVDISGWSLTGGVRHSFPAGTVIPSNGSLFVSPNVKAFLTRATGPSGGQGLFVQGNYQGNMSNFGETVQLIAADGAVMDAFSTPVTPSIAQQWVRISEVHYNPPGNEETTEFIELTNISSTETVDLSGVTLADGPSQPFVIPAGTQLGPGQFVVLVNNQTAFQAAYPGVAANQILGPYVGSLSNSGEPISLTDATGNVIVSFQYADHSLWPQAADGVGASLVAKDLGIPADDFEKSTSWRHSLELGGSPGRVNAALPTIRINEVLANSAANQLDSIELFNYGSQTVDLSGWRLSDAAANLQKYTFGPGSALAPGQFMVISEQQFNSQAQGENAFALGSDGDDVWLTSATGQFVDDVHFGDSRTGESLGRISDVQLFPLAERSLGAGNGAYRRPDVIISEVQYHSPDPTAESLAIFPNMTADDLEFVELYNPSPATVDLVNWRIRGGVDLDFDAGTQLMAGQTAVVVRFNPGREDNALRRQAFIAQYALPADVLLLGGYSGSLSDSEGAIRLEAAVQDGVDPNSLLHPLQDAVLYSDRTPWPTSADGQGNSLQRTNIDAAGVLSTVWMAAAPTPGEFGSSFDPDVNGDGQVTAADIDAVCLNVRANVGSFDLDGNGQLNSNDVLFFVTDVLRTSVGDVNLDGVFNSGDLVAIFTAGEFEDGVSGNSTYAEGDWNCDGDFGTGDLVLAFQAGSYVATATSSVRAETAIDALPEEASQIQLADIAFANGPLQTDFRQPTLASKVLPDLPTLDVRQPQPKELKFEPTDLASKPSQFASNQNIMNSDAVDRTIAFWDEGELW
ncbi:MAG: lamin tail domain-containing protein [Planctomycetales bacterium]|nr:lamin tail domain-containing protein [Planctomycetales bacterium]